jgi:mRNA-degrading endonuclease toxin of MazEF toxin-antitoxin module
MNPGELWIAQLDKRRPVVVIRCAPWLNDLHVVPITSKIRGLKSEVLAVSIAGSTGKHR